MLVVNPLLYFITPVLYTLFFALNKNRLIIKLHSWQDFPDYVQLCVFRKKGTVEITQCYSLS